MKTQIALEIVQLRTDHNLSLTEIANRFQVGRETVARTLRKYKVDTSSKSFGVDKDKEKIIQQYKEGRSLRDISLEYKVSRTVIDRIIQSAGLPVRHQSDYCRMQLDEERICALRDNGNRKIEDIAKIIGCSVAPIKRVLRKHGLEHLDYRTLDIKDEEIIAEYLKGVSAEKVAVRFNCSSTYVHKVLNMNKVVKYKPGTFASRNLPEQEICNKYQNTEHTTDTLAVEYKCAQRTIYRILLKHGVKFKRYQKSTGESTLFAWIKDLAPDAEQSNRTVLDGKEIDIWIPSKQVGIEYNGAYWHSVRYMNATAQVKKLELATSKGIRLIHIWDFEWMEKPEIVQSRLLSILGKTTVIYARKCELRKVSSANSAAFLDRCHIQGNVSASKRLGLYYEDKLVSLMTFGKSRLNKNVKYELLRFCNELGVTVVGAASKLFKHAGLHDVVSYADRRWSSGNLYKQLGFTFGWNSRPNFFYVNGRARLSRHQCMKHKLVLAGASKKKSEQEIMRERHFERVYDCGNGAWFFCSKRKEARLLAEGFSG